MKEIYLTIIALLNYRQKFINHKLKKSLTQNLSTVREALISSGFLRYFNNTAWLFSEQFLRMLSGLLIGIWVARHLGPEQFGIYSYIITIAAICGGLAKLGMDAIIVREFINKPNKIDYYLGTALWIRVASALAIIIILIPIIWLSKNDVGTKVSILVITLGIVFQSAEVIELYFFSQVLAKLISICKIIQLLSSSILKLYCIFADSALIYFVIIFAFDAIFFALAIILAYRRNHTMQFIRRFDLVVAKSLLKDSWPLLLSTAVVLIYQRIDQVLIRHLINDHALGMYAAALKFTDSFYFIPLLLTNSLATALINAKTNNADLYFYRLKSLYILVISISAAIAIAIYASSNIIIGKFYGKHFMEAATLLGMHAVTIIFVGMGIVITRWHIIENRSRIVFYNTLAGAIASLICNIFLIPLYGLQGAVISSVISHFIAAFAMNFFWRDTRSEFFALNTPCWSKS